jgi:alpha-maltose-1-phosphate synthase
MTTGSASSVSAETTGAAVEEPRRTRISGERRHSPTRVLFFNEGNLGTHVLGHDRHAAAMRAGADTVGEVEAHHAELMPMGRVSRAIAYRDFGPLTKRHLDFRALRWQVVQSQRTRRAIERELRGWPADVVHVHSHAIGLTMSATMRRVPVALSVDTTIGDWWGMPAWRPSERYAPLTIEPNRALERRAFSRAAIVLACTRWAQRAIEATAPRARVAEHHPGIDVQQFAPAARRARELPRVLFVGGRFVEKGGEDLLGALAQELGETVELDVVTPAEVPSRPGVRVHRLGPADPELLELFQQADLLCLPTYGDSNPWTVLEAMSCGTPVISSDVGGIPEMLRRDEAGVVVPCGDRRALRDALLALLADPERRRTLGSRAREISERHYDASVQFRRLAEHLQAAVEHHTAATPS